MAEAQIAVIGGSGLYQMEGLADLSEVRVATPFGEPSDVITLGTLEGQRIAFLPRHGRGHRISPSEINARANIYALKLLGVKQIIAVSACGSMRESIAPLDIVIPDQIFDRTKGRPSTFFGQGIVTHIGFADPFCQRLSNALLEATKTVGARVHSGGTYVCIEGPQFSTKAESRIYRQWGVDVIGMTAIPEAKLAREAEICYATLALATDYDVWHESSEPVTVEMVVANLMKNTETAKRIIRAAMTMLPNTDSCGCQSALKDAIITDRTLIPAETKRDLGPLLYKYLTPNA
ncbi:MAG: S-methyl-5'-thioadenosine phosphorylase [Chloroflexi bacterium]|nr:S-methyl-5'-thioadenosine phosphorylase [Chloroflexota bacterium]